MLVTPSAALVMTRPSGLKSMVTTWARPSGRVRVFSSLVSDNFFRTDLVKDVRILLLNLQ